MYFRVSWWVLHLRVGRVGVLWHFPWSFVVDRIEGNNVFWGSAHDSDFYWWTFLGVDVSVRRCNRGG